MSFFFSTLLHPLFLFEVVRIVTFLEKGYWLKWVKPRELVLNMENVATLVWNRPSSWNLSVGTGGSSIGLSNGTYRLSNEEKVCISSYLL